MMGNVRGLGTFVLVAAARLALGTPVLAQTDPLMIGRRPYAAFG